MSIDIFEVTKFVPNDPLFTVKPLKFSLNKNAVMMEEGLRDFLLQEVKNSGIDVNNDNHLMGTVSKSVKNLITLLDDAMTDFVARRRSSEPKIENIFKKYFRGPKLETALKELKGFYFADLQPSVGGWKRFEHLNYSRIYQILYRMKTELSTFTRNTNLFINICQDIKKTIKTALKPPKIKPPKAGGTATKESWLKRLFGKKGQPSEGAAGARIKAANAEIAGAKVVEEAAEKSEGLILRGVKKVGKILKKAGERLVRKPPRL